MSKIHSAVYPLDVISCLYHKETAARLFNDATHFTSYRTGDDNIWKEMVTALIQLCQVVVIDIRNTTQPVEFEINLALNTLKPQQIYFVGTQTDHGEIPPKRCFTEEQLMEQIRSDLKMDISYRTKRSLFGNDTYKDKRNGYFMFMPPSGWRAHEYSDPRSKVQFNHPNQSGVNIRFIVRAAPGENYQSMHLAHLRRVPQARAMGFDCTIQETKFLGIQCSQLSAILPGNAGLSRQWMFLASGLHFNIQYSAPNQSLFNKYLGTVLQSLNTVVVLAQPEGISKKVGNSKSPIGFDLLNLQLNR